MIEKLDTAVIIIGKLVTLSSAMIVAFVVILAVIGLLLWVTDREFK